MNDDMKPEGNELGNDPMDAPKTMPKGEKPDPGGSGRAKTHGTREPSDGDSMITPKQRHGAAVIVRLVQWPLLAIAALSWWALFSATRLVNITALGMYALSTAALVVALEAVTWRWCDG
jgi:hypothetical protein